jgi:hypothetical protein
MVALQGSPTLEWIQKGLGIVITIGGIAFGVQLLRARIVTPWQFLGIVVAAFLLGYIVAFLSPGEYA